MAVCSRCGGLFVGDRDRHWKCAYLNSKERIAELEAALEKYGCHLLSSMLPPCTEEKCSCGLEQVLRRGE